MAIADIIFIIYLIFALGVCVFTFTTSGKELQREYYAFKETRRCMHSKGLRWPPREWLD